jgi:hypothetical protein
MKGNFHWGDKDNRLELSAVGQDRLRKWLQGEAGDMAPSDGVVRCTVRGQLIDP